jgi:hypothetical protein
MELLENRLGYAGDDAQAPEPAAGLNEGVPPLENVAAVQLDKGMAENLDEFTYPVDQVLEMNVGGFLGVQNPASGEVIDLEAWVDAEMPTPLYQEVEPEVQG